jgi:hypothetical protein
MTSINKTVLEYNLDPHRKLSQNEAELEKKIKMVEQSDPKEFGLTEEELSDTTWRSVKNEIFKI